MTTLLLMLRTNDRADQLVKSYLLIHRSFSWMLQTSKYFKLSNFLTSRSCDWIARVVEIERHIFLEK
jgi:hypothetical protein